eukprot:m.108630 g.108630  ORF g.108630 m.108630 type:complete len:112 (+) comp51745_c0_seq4:403-738(+)
MGDVQRTPSEEDLQHMTQHEPRLHAAIRVASVGGAKQEGSGAAAAPGPYHYLQACVSVSSPSSAFEPLQFGAHRKSLLRSHKPIAACPQWRELDFTKFPLKNGTNFKWKSG